MKNTFKLHCSTAEYEAFVKWIQLKIAGGVEINGINLTPMLHRIHDNLQPRRIAKPRTI